MTNYHYGVTLICESFANSGDLMSKYTTKQREVLFALLHDNADKPLSVSDMALLLQDEGISLSAIYRNLAELEKDGQVQRLTVGGENKVYYRYTGAKECEKHLHLSCRKCGKTFHMDIPATNALIGEVLNKSNFQIDSANTVIYGICEKCNR